MIKEIELKDLREFGGSYGTNFYTTNLKTLKESIKCCGLINPIIVRPDNTGKALYEIIEGHTRVRAFEELGYKTIKAEIRELSDDEAVMIYCESNEQRCKKTIMEKAYSLFYRKRFCNECLEYDVKDISSLVNLSEKMQCLVNNKKIKIDVALTIVGMSEESQEKISTVLMGREKTLTKEMVDKIKEMEKKNIPTYQAIEDIINKSQEKIAYKKIKVSQKVFNMFPANMTHKEKVQEMENLLVKAMKEKYVIKGE